MKKNELKVTGVIEETEGARRATVVSSITPAANHVGRSAVPDPEVVEKATRRKFTAEYKRKILAEAGNCKELGQIGMLLRREGLYYSNLTKWRMQAEKGTLDALSVKKRGPKICKPDPVARRVAELEKENQKLVGQLKKAELIIAAQKKIAEIFQSFDPQEK